MKIYLIITFLLIDNLSKFVEQNDYKVLENNNLNNYFFD
jgi:hypothetical protein